MAKVRRAHHKDGKEADLELSGLLIHDIENGHAPTDVNNDFCVKHGDDAATLDEMALKNDDSSLSLLSL